MSATPPDPVLAVSALAVEFRTSERTVSAVRDVSFSVGRAETVAIVGESGSGKSVTALSVLRLVEHGGGRILAGKLDFLRPGGQHIDLVQADAATLRSIRGAEIAMIFQEPMTSLNPVYTVGEQIAESVRLHEGLGRKAALERAGEMLALGRIPTPERRVDDYPHQFSGGMRQRVMIAIALACNPKLLIADEPTTALDVTIQAQILSLLDDLKARLGMAVLLITHDMGVVAGRADRVNVMYAGRIVEGASTSPLFSHMHHPYTQALL